MSPAARRVHVLTSHADPQSLTVAVADTVAGTLRAAGCQVTTENLASSGFVTTFGDADLAHYRGFLAGEPAEAPPQVLDQQRVLESSDALVLVFPVYWWSFPAELKGWIDRVFTGGWTWGLARSGREGSALAHLDVHLVPLVGTGEDLYVRHGYGTAMQTQIQHGIVEYNGLRSGSWTWLWDAANRPGETLARAGEIAAAAASPVALTAAG